MRYKKVIFCFFVLLAFYSCGNKLLNPVKGGVSYSKQRQKKSDSKIVARPDVGTILYIQPKRGLTVRAIEDCKISKTSFEKDSSISIFAKGSLDAGYGHISKCFVSKGDFIRKGHVIGELFPADSTFDNALTLSLFKDGKAVVPNW
jgi:peptidase M23-like protein